MTTLLKNMDNENYDRDYHLAEYIALHNHLAILCLVTEDDGRGSKYKSIPNKELLAKLMSVNTTFKDLPLDLQQMVKKIRKEKYGIV